MKTGIRKVLALLVFLAPALATADPIVFENAYEDGEKAAGTAWCSGCGTLWRVWDNFTLSEDTDITQIDAHVYFGGSPNIEYSVWTPDRSTMLFSQVLSVSELWISSLFPGSAESDLIASITGLRLSAGEYALSIWDMAYSGSYFAWYSTSLVHDGYAYQSLYSDGTGYLGGGTSMAMAFRVHGVTVPEPGTLALLGIGLAGLAAARRRITV